MGDPAQIVAGTEVKVTLTGRVGLTIIPIEFEVAGLFIVQAIIEEFNTHFILSPFNGVYVKVVELEPALTPFTFH